MAANEVPPELVTLVDKMQTEYRDSEYDIAVALAEAHGPLTTEELADETGYTERTIKKRVGTLEEALRGEPLITVDDDGAELHPRLAEALRGASA
jgi:predicted transcriptional regulator